MYTVSLPTLSLATASTVCVPSGTSLKTSVSPPTVFPSRRSSRPCNPASPVSLALKSFTLRVSCTSNFASVFRANLDVTSGAALSATTLILGALAKSVYPSVTSWYVFPVASLKTCLSPSATPFTAVEVSFSGYKCKSPVLRPSPKGFLVNAIPTSGFLVTKVVSSFLYWPSPTSSMLSATTFCAGVGRVDCSGVAFSDSSTLGVSFF